MKRKKANSPNYPDGKDPTRQLKEDAAVYGLRRDVLGVREAKDQLSSLLQRAATGEEIVITSDGRPKAMIVRYRPRIVGIPARSRAALRATMPLGPDSTAATASGVSICTIRNVSALAAAG